MDIHVFSEINSIADLKFLANTCSFNIESLLKCLILNSGYLSRLDLSHTLNIYVHVKFLHVFFFSELKKGWWKIFEEEHVRTMHRNLHPRGIREKSLQKNLQKCLEHACSSCDQENKESKEILLDTRRKKKNEYNGTYVSSS